MASGSFSLTRKGSTSTYISFNCNWVSVANQTANTSTVTVTVTASKNASATASTYGKQTTTVNIDGNKQTNSGSFTLAPAKTIALFQKSFTVKHNANGSKTVKISVNVGGNVIYASGSATCNLDTIPRYASITQSVKAKTETTATIKYVSDAVIDYLWYSTNNGTSWTGIDVADGSKGEYIISGLTPDTTYQVITRVRRKDSQLKSETTAMSVKTYDYPYAKTMPNFTIGERVTIGLYNPLNRSVTISLIGADESQISSDTTTGTSVTGYNSSTVKNRLYASIPNNTNGIYKVSVAYGTNINTKVGGLYSINENECRPNIGVITYEDTNSSTIALTGNNKLIIRNQSTVRYEVEGLSGRYSATIALCTVKVNGNTYDLPISGTTASGGNATIDSGADLDATITLTDSRGVKASKTVKIDMIDWYLPKALISLNRKNNYKSDCDILVEAVYALIGGANLLTITYNATKEGDISPSVTGTLTDNTPAVITLNNNYAWSVAVTLTDTLGGTTTYNLFVCRGIPVMFFDKNKASVGVNCYPEGDNTFEVDGFTFIYKAGNTEAVNAYQALGMVTDNMTKLRFTVFLPKSIANVTPSITELKVNVRKSEGGFIIASSYTSGGYNVLTDPDLTVSVAKASDNAITIDIDSTTAFNCTNDTPQAVSVESLRLSFS